MPKGAVMREDMMITKMMRPNDFAVPNPWTVFIALTETTKIHTIKPIAATAMSPA